MVRVSLADMDRETRENYTVVIQAKDMGGQLGGLAGTTTVNITLSDINDNPPMFDQSKQPSADVFLSFIDFLLEPISALRRSNMYFVSAAMKQQHVIYCRETSKSKTKSL